MWSNIKRVATDTLGFLLILAGLLTGWLPGPGGIPLIVAGLGLLAINNQWAKNLLHRFEDQWKELNHKITHLSPAQSKMLDAFSIILLFAGTIILLQVDGNNKFLGIGPLVMGLTFIAINQNRFKRIAKLFKIK
jgi:hypothetical protein